jgi:glycine cleavage system aminomethyltransferase T
VNRLLVGLKIAGQVESATGAELSIDSKAVGKITSVSQLAQSNGPNAIGFVRRGHSQSGTVLEFEGGTATVMD